MEDYVVYSPLAVVEGLREDGSAISLKDWTQ
jgi:hypothetical protein